MAGQAYRAENAFAGNEAARSIRALASLYPEKQQIVTRRDANIRSIGDFRGKRIFITRRRICGVPECVSGRDCTYRQVDG